jgi:hypothetical protein
MLWIFAVWLSSAGAVGVALTWSHRLVRRWDAQARSVEHASHPIKSQRWLLYTPTRPTADTPHQQT